MSCPCWDGVEWVQSGSQISHGWSKCVNWGVLGVKGLNRPGPWSTLFCGFGPLSVSIRKGHTGSCNDLGWCVGAVVSRSRWGVRMGVPSLSSPLLSASKAVLGVGLEAPLLSWAS